jgi:hypothetical protein
MKPCNSRARVAIFTAALLILGGAGWANAQAVRGTGTANKIPLWTSSNTIGDSSLSQSGTNLSTGGSISAASFTGDGSALSNVNATKLGGILPSGFAQLSAASNPFTGNVSVEGTLSGSIINSGNGGFQFNGVRVLSALGGDTAVGISALALGGGGDNTATGNSALFFTTGSGNTGNGAFTLGDLGSGSNNTAIGVNTLDALNTGSSNTAIGANAGINLSSSESNNIDINNAGATGDAGIIRIGTSGTQTATYIAGIYNTTTGSSTTSMVVVDNNGQLGTVASSRRYKEDIHDMGTASDGLLRLRPVTFRYKKAYADGSKPIEYGLVAEEVAEVYPDLVVSDKDGQPETVQYYKLDAMLVNEVQKLAKLHVDDQAEITKLQSEVAWQRKQAQGQQAAMKQLQAQVRAIIVAHDQVADGNKRLLAASAREGQNP